MKHGKLWPLYLVFPFRAGRWYTAVAIFLVWLLIVGSLGGIDPDQAQFSSLLFFCCLFTYMIPCFHYTIESSIAAVTDLKPVMALSDQEFISLRESMHRRPFWSMLVTLAIGALIGSLQSYFLFAYQSSPPATVPVLDRLDVVVILATVFIWCLMTTIVQVLIENARKFSAVAQHSVEIDLLDPQRLTPLARVAVISTLSIIGALAMFPLMFVEGEAILLAMIPGLVALLIPMFWLFLLPIWPAHKRIKAAKQEQLDLVQRQMNELRAANPDSRKLVEDLQPFLVYRNEISQVSEWPFDSVAIARLVLYLIIPPLTWIGAALIEKLVDTMV